MYLLPCPSCQTSITVSPSQAGDTTTCPACQSAIDIPKLGQLRQLDRAEQTPSATVGPREVSTGRQIGFMVLGLVAIASLLAAGFCGIRWALIEVPTTTDEHVAELREAYHTLSAAELIREYESMEKYGLDLGSPYKYKQIENEKKAWGNKATATAIVGGLAVIGAVIVGLVGRKRT